jgi:radical SAM superfamily enzyme YgiQ (UPF0313 family)
MEYKSKQINLGWIPFGYAYSVPLSSGYLKSSLLTAGYPNVKIFDFNQDFWYRNQDSLGSGVKPFEERYQSILQNVTNWNNPENYYEHIHSITSISDLIEEYSDSLLENNPSIIGMTIFNTNLWFSIEICKLLKEKNNDVQIILGGPEATASSYDEHHVLKDLLKDGTIDVVVFGEGDVTIVEVCNTILSNEHEYSTIDGIYYHEAGEIKTNKWRRFIANVNEIPIPDYSDIDFSLYQQPEIPIVLSRGCNYGCLYCGVKLYWKQAKDFRKRTAESVMEEIVNIDHSGYITKGQFNFLSFKGAYVNTLDNHLETLCDAIIEYYREKEHGVPFQWGGWARVHKNLTADVCKKLYASGCHHLTFGFESGSVRINKEMRKGYDFREYNNEYAAKIFKNCADAGIQVVLFLIIGYPTETESDFQETMTFLKENNDSIDAVYCMSTFILSRVMFNDDDKTWGKSSFGIKGDDPHPVFWESETNTYEERLVRLETFKTFADENNLTTISSRV